MVYLINLILVFIYYSILNRIISNKFNAFKINAFLLGMHALLFRLLANPFNYPDTQGYALAFLEIGDYSINETLFSLNKYTQWGQGYVFLNWIIGQFTDNPIVFFTCITFLSILPVAWFFYKTSYNLIITYSIYFVYPMMYIMGFGVLRQHLAVAWVLVAIYYANDNTKLSILISIIAVFLHTSAIIVIPYFLYRYFLKDIYKSWFLFVIIIIGSLLMRYSVGFLLEFTGDRNENFADEGNSNLTNLVVVGIPAIFYYTLNIVKRIKSDIEIEILLFSSYGLMLSLFGLGMAGSGRLLLYNLYAIPVMLTHLYKHCSKDNNKIIIITFIIVIFFLGFYRSLSSVFLSDYQSIFSYI